MLHQKGPPRTSEDTVVKAQAQTGVITILRTPFLGRTWRQKCFLLFGNAFLSLTLAPMAASLLTSPTPPTHCPPPCLVPCPQPQRDFVMKGGMGKGGGNRNSRANTGGPSPVVSLRTAAHLLRPRLHLLPAHPRPPQSPSRILQLLPFRPNKTK